MSHRHTAGMACWRPTPSMRTLPCQHPACMRVWPNSACTRMAHESPRACPSSCETASHTAWVPALLENTKIGATSFTAEPLLPVLPSPKEPSSATPPTPPYVVPAFIQFACMFVADGLLLHAGCQAHTHQSALRVSLILSHVLARLWLANNLIMLSVFSTATGSSQA